MTTKPPIDFEIYDELRKDRDRLRKREIELERAIGHLERQLFNERRAAAAEIRREAQRAARDLIFAGGNA